MKKLTTIRRLAMVLAAAMMLPLLAGCAGGTEASPAPGTSGKPGTETPAVSAAPEVSSTPEVNYLADPMFDTDEYLPDYDETCVFRNSGTFTSFCETDTVCYGIRKYQQLMFWDKQTGICAPLCGKPECDHSPDTLTCNARIQSSFDVSLYDGKIWFSSPDPTNWTAPESLWSINPDGTSREKVIEIDEIREFNSYAHIYPHRGYVYCSGIIQLTVDGVPSERLRMFAKALDTGETVEIMDCTYPQSAHIYYSIQWSGNNLYILKTADSKTEILRWDSKTRTLESLYFTDDDTFFWHDLGISEDGKTLYITAVDNQDDGSQLSSLYNFDLESLTLTRAFTMDDMGDDFGVVFGDRYVLTKFIHDPKEGEGKVDRILIKDLGTGDVLYEGFDLPEGIERGDIEGISYVGGNRENFYLMLRTTDAADNLKIKIACLSLGDTPKMSILWDEYY